MADDDLDWGALEPIEAAIPPPAQDPVPVEAEVLAPAPTQDVLAPGLNPLGLTEQEAIFAREYVKTSSLAAAARAAGLEGQSSIGRKVLDRPHVAAEVARLAMAEGKQLIEAAGENITIAVDQIILALYEISSASVLDAYEQGEDGTVKAKLFKNLPPNLRAAVKSVKFNAKGEMSLELYSKLDALKMLKDFFQDQQKRPSALNIPGEEPVPQPTAGTITVSRKLTFEQVIRTHGQHIATGVNGAPV